MFIKRQIELSNGALFTGTFTQMFISDIDFVRMLLTADNFSRGKLACNNTTDSRFMRIGWDDMHHYSNINTNTSLIFIPCSSCNERLDTSSLHCTCDMG